MRRQQQAQLQYGAPYDHLRGYGTGGDSGAACCATHALTAHRRQASSLLQQHQPPQVSRSTTTLPRTASCGSYSLLPAAAGGVPACASLAGRAPYYPGQFAVPETAMATHWPQPSGSFCCLHSLAADSAPKCTCLKAAYNAPPVPSRTPHAAAHMEASPLLQHHHHAHAPSHAHMHQQQQRHRAHSGMYYLGHEHGGYHSGMADEEDDSAFPALQEREFHMLHRQIPALRRTGVDTDGIRQYFYPEGGWGWIVCGVAFLVHILSSGLQLSYGLLLFYALQHLHNAAGIEWLGALSWSVSLLVTPFVVAYCRSKSARLLAVIGGIVAPLGVLFTSFATEMGQVVFAYGLVFGVGAAMVRESAAFMIGSYFKRRRKFVEMVAMSGEGVGIALFSVVLKEGVGKAGWRLGLQIIAGLLATTFFMGLLYRPASLYHPQRRAIQHLKNQHKKMRENKLSTSAGAGMSAAANERAGSARRYCLFLDVSVLRSATVQVLLLATGVAALGTYAPMFLMSLNAAKEGSDVQDLVLLQAFLGIAMVCGVVLAGTLMRRPFRVRNFVVSSEVVSQVFIAIVALAILFLSFVMGYKSLCALSWVYGIGFGGFRYSLKILALERIKLRQFSKAWGFMKGVEAIPVALGVPLASFLNDYSLKYGRAGYYICSAAAAIAAIIIFFINYSTLRTGGGSKQAADGERARSGAMANGGAAAASHRRSQLRRGEEYAFQVGGARCGLYPSMDMLHRSCMNLQQAADEDDDMFVRHAYTPRRSSWYERAPPPPPPPPLACLMNHPYDAPLQLPAETYQERRQIRPPCGFLPEASAAGGGESAKRRYRCGQGSVGAYAGRQLQKSLSFIQNPYCCDGEWFCNCYQPGQGRTHKPINAGVVGQVPLVCTCGGSPNMPPPAHLASVFGSAACLHGTGASAAAKSRSVPEGLSAMSERCNCHLAPQPALPRELVYMPHKAPSVAVPAPTPQAKRCRDQRSHSLSKAPTTSLHYVEQITTSV